MVVVCHRRLIEEGPTEMSYPVGTPFQKETTHGAWATNSMQALFPFRKRVSGDARLPHNTATTFPLPEHSPNASLLKHYPSSRPSMSDKSVSTTITTARSDEMAVTYDRAETASSPQPPSKHEWRFYAAFGCLCIISLVVALDMTSLSVALPVGFEAWV